MYNLLIAIAISAVVFGAAAAGFGPWAGIFPALFVFPVAMFLLARRTGQQVQAVLAPIPELAQAGKVDEVRKILEDAREQYGSWQFFLGRQLTAQMGMLHYMKMEFDEALPLLEQSWRDWSTTVAAAAVHYRRKRFDEAWKAFEDARSYSPKEPALYAVEATLRSRKGDREGALGVLVTGLAALPDHPLLRKLKNRIANKQRIDVGEFEQVWFQFFPEELMQRMQMRGARPGSIPDIPGVAVQHRQGPPQPRTRGKMARRR